MQLLLRLLNPEPQDLCTIMYISGTTGNPKVCNDSFLNTGIGLLLCNEESGEPWRMLVIHGVYRRSHPQHSSLCLAQ